MHGSFRQGYEIKNLILSCFINNYCDKSEFKNEIFR